MPMTINVGLATKAIITRTLAGIVVFLESDLFNVVIFLVLFFKEKTS
jgi:hypothetical protein